MNESSIRDVLGLGPRGWIYIKLGVLLLMMILLWIPLSFVDGLVRERQTRQQAVIGEISQIPDNRRGPVSRRSARISRSNGAPQTG